MIFANSTKTPSDGTLLGRTSKRFLLCWLLFFVTHCCSSFIAVFVMLFFIHCFSTSSLTLLWAIAGFLHSFYTFGPAHRRVILDTFILTFPSPSFTVLLRALRYWSGRFFTHRRFNLTLLPHIFDTTCFYEGLPGIQQFFLEVCRASCWSSKHWPGPSVCLIHSNPQSWYSEKFVFKSYQILSWITCGKKFSLSAPYSFRTLFTCSKYM